jgi:predicted NAD/FAD-dependent oxidoreductase
VIHIASGGRLATRRKSAGAIAGLDAMAQYALNLIRTRFTNAFFGTPPVGVVTIAVSGADLGK